MPELKFADANRLSLGTKIRICFDCDITVGDRRITAFEPLELVHEQHDETVHWYLPETEMFVPNAMLRKSELLEVSLNFTA